ncbi:MAG TPA: class I SAM-dependent methyltransferase [Dehalococcoidia bacterium]|nr:class I SAM-dependent methyltransferase [Dehalococcoidia bacterium]
MTRSAIEYWRERVESHHAQTHRARGDRPEGDLWSGLADSFRGDPRRTDDPVVNLVSEWLAPGKTVLDVGGGAGRYALPFALKAKQVTVVEPSPAMLEALEAAKKEAGIENVSSVAEKWEQAEVAPHDVVFCANVVYGVTDIEPFLRRLNEAASEIVAIVVFHEGPLTQLSDLWAAVHREERINLPALPELLPVLWEMEVYPNVTVMPPVARLMPNKEAALGLARHMLWVDVGSEADHRLTEAMDRLLVETPEGVTLRRRAPVPAVVWWRKGVE